MITRFRGAVLALTALAASVGTANAAGMWSTIPVVGNPAGCGGFVTGTGGFTIPQGNTGGAGATGQGQGVGGSTICSTPIPAGPPALTGAEVIPADTGLQTPATVTIPLGLVGGYNNRINRLIGGDFATNLWQRGTTFSAITPTSATLTADRWAAFSTGNTVTITKQTGAADTFPAAGLYASMRVSRPSGTNATAICVGQTMDKEATAELVGKNGVLSFYALAGAGLNAAASNNITVTVAYYTAADSATPGTNTGTFMAGTIAGYTPAVAGLSQITAQSGTSASVTNGTALIPISTTWTRYAVYAPIPLTNASGTAVTGAGVTICYTPASGTTGGSTEWFEIAGVQLQAQNGPTASMPAGLTAPTGFEMRSPALEAVIEQSYSYVLTDGAATLRYAMCQAISTTNAVCPINFPTSMRITPATTVGTAASFGSTVAAGTAQACSNLAAVATSNTLSSGSVNCTAATYTQGSASQLIGAATGGLLTFSAEP